MFDEEKWKLWRDSMESRLEHLEGGYKRQKDLLQTNTEICVRLEEGMKTLDQNTSSLVQLFMHGESAFNLFVSLMTGVRWIIRFVILPTAVIFVAGYVIVYGKLPDWFKALLTLVSV